VSDKRLADDAIVVRAADDDDEPALESFACSEGLECEDEVEEFIRSEAMKTMGSGVADYRLLLAFEEERLAGVIGHRIDMLILNSGKTLQARQVNVLAVGSEYRGSVFKDNSPLSNRLLASMIEEVEGFSDNDIYTVIIANENDRSLEMFERCGSWSQVAYDLLHVRLTGRFTL
jgi:hypothetical protein